MLRRIIAVTPQSQVRKRFFFQQTPHMKRHHERKLIKYPPELLYEVVSDVDKYHEFVPWCQKSKVLSKNNESMSAELTVGFKYFTEKYISQVQLKPDKFVSACSTQTNLFEYLKTEWKFSPAQAPGTTWVSFQVDFKFRSTLYNEVSEYFLSEVVCNMVKAFEERCKQLHNARRNHLVHT
eukprot:gene28334-34210_t